MALFSIQQKSICSWIPFVPNKLEIKNEEQAKQLQSEDLIVTAPIETTNENDFSLKIFSPTFYSENEEKKPILLGTHHIDSYVEKIIWGKSIIQDSFPLGVLAAGMNDGSINLWNPNSIIQSDSENVLISHVSHHSQKVLDLDFNFNFKVVSFY
eukprot:Anaeramoba_ignava/a607452_78.p2 GENE.a607452_78~~a607452_78.p2  ORF type:complete len:154 (+),score=49.16 a607452_78:90-551(+)